MLCKAQQLKQTSSTAHSDCNRIPVLSILHLPFKVPKVHSTSFLIDSAHFDHLVPLIDDVLFHGHIVQLHGVYPPSTRKKVGTAPIAVEVAMDDIVDSTFSVSTLIDF